MALHFAVPFLLLLSRRLESERRTGIFRIAVLLLVMRYVDLYWLIVPGFQRGESGASRTHVSLARFGRNGGDRRRLAVRCLAGSYRCVLGYRFTIPSLWRQSMSEPSPTAVA